MITTLSATDRELAADIAEDERLLGANDELVEFIETHIALLVLDDRG